MKNKSFLIAIAVIAIATSCNNQRAENNKSNEKIHDEMKNIKMDTMTMEKMDSTMMHSNHQPTDSIDKK
jgi:hypothetical protein